MDLQKKMREVLTGLVAEEELEAVLDAELTNARKNLRQSAARTAQEFIEGEMKTWVADWKKTEAAKEAIKDLAIQLVEKKKQEWLDGSSYSSDQIKNKVQNIFDKEVQREIEQNLYEHKFGKDISAAASKAVEMFLPKAAAMALEGLAIRALKANLITAEANMGLVDLTCSQWNCNGKVIPGKYCPDCGNIK
jgi:hypothetical protein